jgi:hypothetical protein
MSQAANRVLELPAGPAGNPRVWSGPHEFVQLADTQFGMTSALKGVQYLNWINWLTCELTRRKIPVPADMQPGMSAAAADELEKAMAREAVRAINAMRPRPAFVCVCGDLVNAYPAQAELQRTQVADFKAIFAKVDAEVPLVCVCRRNQLEPAQLEPENELSPPSRLEPELSGPDVRLQEIDTSHLASAGGNHDIGDRPTPEAIATYAERFGDDYFVFWCRGVKYVVLNSQLYKERPARVELAIS